MNRKTNLALIVLALAAGVSAVPAQTLLWSDSQFLISPTDWGTVGWPGILQSVNGQLIVTENFFGSAQTNNPIATHVPGVHALSSFGALPDQHTLELRADLVGANQNDAWAGIHFNWAGSGYAFFKDEDEVALCKFYNHASSFAWFFYTNQPVKNQNVTLVLALTLNGANLNITTRVLDKDNAKAVLFDRTVTDTPQADPVLSSRGFISMADPPGSPWWPLLPSPTSAEVTLSWVNPQHAPNPRAQVIFDNVEVWQYESPQLAIQNAVVLSWPLTQGPFALESSASVTGPWLTVSSLWCRTNAGRNEVSISASDSLRLFRLRQGFPSYIPFDRAQGEVAEGVAVDLAGNVYVSIGGPFGPRQGEIWKFTPMGEKSLLINFDTPGIVGLAVDRNTNVYVARNIAPYNGVYRVDPSGQAIRLPGTEQIVMPNGLAFDSAGNLYVTEYFSFDPPLTPFPATNGIASAFGRGGIWRIAPGGSAQLWLRDDLLTGTGIFGLAGLTPFPCGANGIGYYQGALYVASTEKGLVLRIPILANGGPGTIATVAQVPDPDPSLAMFGPPVPDGLTLDSEGNIYVPVINRGAVVRISADGSAWKTLATAADHLDSPASVAFGTTPTERTKLFVTSLSMVPGYAGPSLIKIETGIPGLPLP